MLVHRIEYFHIHCIIHPGKVHCCSDRVFVHPFPAMVFVNIQVIGYPIFWAGVGGGYLG